MKLLVLLAIIIGIFLFLSFLALVIYGKIKKIAKMYGYSNFNELKNMIQKGEDEYKYNHKMVSGMTNLIVPRIIKDFPNFSLSELYNKTEVSLRTIFSTLESRQINPLKELSLIKDNLKERIKDMKENKIELSFSDVVFHKHAIKYYENDGCTLSITVSTSLEYYYTKKENGKIIVSSNIKKQTSYTTTYIYIYDMDKYDEKQTLISIHCPNCGAPLKSLNDRNCRYCQSSLDDINLKCWYISAYKEDY